MVAIVIGINLVVGLSLLWLAWQTRKTQAKIAAATQSILGYALACQRGLENAPVGTLKVQAGVSKLRDRYHILQTKQIRQLSSIVKGCQTFIQLLARSNRMIKNK
jgi:hypothetical protein